MITSHDIWSLQNKQLGQYVVRCWLVKTAAWSWKVAERRLIRWRMPAPNKWISDTLDEVACGNCFGCPLESSAACWTWTQRAEMVGAQERRVERVEPQEGLPCTSLAKDSEIPTWWSKVQFNQAICGHFPQTPKHSQLLCSGSELHLKAFLLARGWETEWGRRPQSCWAM